MQLIDTQVRRGGVGLIFSGQAQCRSPSAPNPTIDTQKASPRAVLQGFSFCVPNPKLIISCAERGWYLSSTLVLTSSRRPNHAASPHPGMHLHRGRPQLEEHWVGLGGGDCVRDRLRQGLQGPGVGGPDRDDREAAAERRDRGGASSGRLGGHHPAGWPRSKPALVTCSEYKKCNPSRTVTGRQSWT